MGSDRELAELQKRAIDEALAGNWQEAKALNERILKHKPDDLDAHLRLGYAHLQEGDLKKSKGAYLHALKIQPVNHIARSHLDKIKILKKKKKKKSDREKRKASLDPELFINVRGITKLVTLKNVGQAQVLVDLKVGQEVTFKIKKRRVEVRTADDEYVGALPDDISKRLIFFLNAGSRYSAFIKDATRNSVDVFIREEERGKKVSKYVSFPENLRDDMKKMAKAAQDGEEKEEEENGEPDEGDEEDEEPVDIEQLAEEVETSEVYPGGTVSADDEEEE